MRKMFFILLFIYINVFGSAYYPGLPVMLRDTSEHGYYVVDTIPNPDDTIGFMSYDKFYYNCGEFSDSLWVKIFRGEYGVLDSLLADTIKGYLKGETDSSIFADTAHYAELLLGKTWDTLGAYLDTNTVLRDSIHAYGEATDSFTTPKLKVDIISPLDSNYTRFTDDAVFDSTLHVAVVHYAVRIEVDDNNDYYQFSATTGSGTSLTVLTELPINHYNLDSVQIDSIRWGGNFYGDSIAIYRLILACYEETSTSITEITYQNVGDSIYIPDDSATPQWNSKVFTGQHGSSKDIFKYPFFMKSIQFYWHNRANAAANIRMYPPLIYLTAYYSKK